MHNRRTRYLVDGNLQWRLTRRSIATWLLGGFMVFCFPIAVSFMYGVFIEGNSSDAVSKNLTQALWFPLLLALLVVPIGIRDSFRFSNRIAGPMMRLKRNMADLAAGQSVRPICLRPGDFFSDVVDSFNRLVQDYQHLQELVTRSNPEKNPVSEHAAKALQHLPGAAGQNPQIPSTAATSASPAGKTVPMLPGQQPWTQTTQSHADA